MSETSYENDDVYTPWVIEDEADAGRPHWVGRQMQSALEMAWRRLLEGRPEQVPPPMDRCAERGSTSCSATGCGNRTAGNEVFAVCQLS